MSNEELVQLYQNGDKESLNKLVDLNEGIIYKIANKFYVDKSSSIDIDDLIQEGFVGLVLAADKYRFDVESPAKFITFAVYWICHKISRFINSKNTNDEVSLNTHVGEEDNSELIDYIEGVDYGFENVEEKIYNHELRIELEYIMNKTLTLNEREILKLRHGWDSNKCMTRDEIGELFNFVSHKVNYIEKRAYSKLWHTSWGMQKAEELHICNKKSKRYNYKSVIDDITFEEEYLNVEI